jgi:hypothetical protein
MNAYIIFGNHFRLIGGRLGGGDRVPMLMKSIDKLRTSLR